MQAQLTPSPLQYTVGMAVTIVPSSANDQGATLDLNGLGEVPIMKWGQMPLDSGDLKPNVPARLIYDGSQFQLLSAVPLSCPTDFKAVSQQFCISNSNYGPGGFYTAAQYCASINARLCTFNEWLQACRGDPDFINTVSLEGEWVDHAANSSSDAKRMGVGSNGNGVDIWTPGCNWGATNSTTYNVVGIRCCSNL